MQGLKGRRIIVAGGASGIGASTAERLAREGARVFIGDINKTGLEAIVERLRAAGGDVAGVQFDLADTASIDGLIRGCVETFGGIDGLADIAADIASSHVEVTQDLTEMTPELWDRTFRVNTTGYALTIKAALPHLKAAGGGSIVVVSSTAGYAPTPYVPAYAASKAGVQSIMRHVALRFGKDNIRCNCVAPGWVLTESNKRSLDEERHKAAVKSVYLTRLGEAEDIASAITFFLSDEATWITGQTLAVNGGGASPG